LALHIGLLEHWDRTTMAYRWPAGTAFKRIDVDVAVARQTPRKLYPSIFD